MSLASALNTDQLVDVITSQRDFLVEMAAKSFPSKDRETLNAELTEMIGLKVAKGAAMDNASGMLPADKQKRLEVLSKQFFPTLIK